MKLIIFNKISKLYYIIKTRINTEFFSNRYCIVQLLSLQFHCFKNTCSKLKYIDNAPKAKIEQLMENKLNHSAFKAVTQYKRISIK